MDPSYDEIVRKFERYVFQTYTRQPLAIKRARGAVVTDISGKDYIDCVAGIAVNNVGHCHPAVVGAIKHQAGQLIHVSNLYYTEEQAVLAEELVNLTGMDRVFFCNSGAEAVEGALKLARKASGKKEFIAAEHAFHGRTRGALSVTHKEKYRKPFEPLSPAVFVPYNDTDAIRAAITKETAGVILEPIQGEGGVIVPSDDYLKEVREICDETDTLLILDEVQTGFGRTGKWFAKEHFGIRGDIMTVAKAMGGGFPMGAMLACEDIAVKFERGDHASTFGGNALSCAAALANIEVIKNEGLVERSRELGEYLINKLNALDKSYIREIRGKGLIVGMELSIKCDDIVNKARDRGVLLNCTSESVLRFIPPLTITKEQLDRVVEVLNGI
ncbi:acetylornithine/succinylornithine aminotransferase [Candidatus Methanoperedens nitroreducens]|uniref:Acetylornithine aminotransferase n=1 Tax=Candidatus Methanoperedens nitratireducens TaxID=1392998 RepID=A0A062VDB8_9EURY|nr:acetylornithine transaminase [Candidatus Methanoperedens nitroreducens]KCZ73659.1 acetylornithine/succinylornithine aminotransferase [Candidatus Methanoperedens nitroreducens]MDJ1422382.1 acetylornithine transaminase [Candidatus Methanoperedens sp.]